METRKISVTEALKELKLYDQKIQKACESCLLIGAKKKSSNKVGYTDVEIFISNAKADYQSINDLEENRDRIKRAVTLSNALTNVEIAGKKYTVAEAIDKKNSIVYKQLMLETMKQQWASATAQVTRENNRVDAQVDKMLETFLGKDSDKKVSETDLSAISDPYRAKNEWELVDPLDLYHEIQEKDKEIDEFMADVDTRLSISNSITYIEV